MDKSGTLSQKWDNWALRENCDFFPGHVVKNWDCLGKSDTVTLIQHLNGAVDVLFVCVNRMETLRCMLPLPKVVLTSSGIFSAVVLTSAYRTKSVTSVYTSLQVPLSYCSLCKWVNEKSLCCRRRPLPSNRQHLSCGDCLEGKRGDYFTSSVLLCIINNCAHHMHTYIMSSSYTVDLIGL